MENGQRIAFCSIIKYSSVTTLHFAGHIMVCRIVKVAIFSLFSSVLQSLQCYHYTKQRAVSFQHAKFLSAIVRLRELRWLSGWMIITVVRSIVHQSIVPMIMTNLTPHISSISLTASLPIKFTFYHCVLTIRIILIQCFFIE